MRLYLINPNNPLVSLAKVRESRWNRYRVWKPLGLLVLAGLTPPEWEITVIDENLRAADYSAMPPPRTWSGSPPSLPRPTGRTRWRGSFAAAA